MCINYIAHNRTTRPCQTNLPMGDQWGGGMSLIMQNRVHIVYIVYGANRPTKQVKSCSKARLKKVGRLEPGDLWGMQYMQAGANADVEIMAVENCEVVTTKLSYADSPVTRADIFCDHFCVSLTEEANYDGKAFA